MQSTISGGYIAVNGSGIDNNLFLIENAVKMVELGAGIEEIMQECELPKAEAELLLSLHKHRSGN